MAATESDIAAKLIERLLADPAFRDRFRRNPPAACREAGLDSLADEMAIGAGNAMHTLDMRESRSSLAGVMMAAAMEGMGLYEFSRHVVPQIEDLSGSIGDVLSRVNLPALPGGGSLAGTPPPSAAPLPATDAAADGNGGGAEAAASAAPVAPATGAAAAPPTAAAAAPEVAGKGAGAGKDAAAPPELAGKRDAGQGDGAGGGGRAKADDGGGSRLPGGPASGAADAPAGATRGDPGGSALPAEQVEPKAATGGKLPDGKAAPQPAAAAPAAAPPAAPVAPETAAAAPPPEPQPPAAAPPVEPQAPEKRAPIDADQFGQEGTGTGGKPDAEALAILKNKNITFDSVGVADIKAGRIDPRIVAVLTKLSQEHKIVVSCMCSDHPRMTTSGFVSNHTYGRGLDIASIDGEIVSPGSALAREVASELSEFPASIRGDEIGSPFAISGPGYFTDAAHQNHIHVGFKTEISPDWEPPPGLRADAPAAAPAAAPAVAAPAGVAPVAGVAAAPAAAPPAPAVARDPERGSGLFAAIAQPAEGKVASAGGSDSGLFSALDPKAAQPAQVAAVPAPAPGAAPAADVAAGAVDVSAVSDAYPGDDATKEQLAAWMGKLAEKRGLPPQLPVMASLVESGLKNLNFGDADSVGFFQMRLSYWNQGDYAGYPDDPKKQVDWFLDQAEQIKAQRESRGQSVTDPKQFGEWIADVERPAEQYRGRYQLQLDQANTLLKAAPPPAAPEVAAAPAPAPAAPAAAPVEPQAPERRAPIDADQFGQEGTGTGGKPDAEALAILKNKNITFDSVGVADIKAGRIDPRIVAVLTKLSQEHKIVVSCMCSDHPRMTTSGFVSNHTYGRGLDIASIDGEIVSPGSALAREVASELSEFPASIRGDEIGSPFAISGPGYFTDAAHQNHIHVGFKTEISPDWKPPEGLRADAPAAAPAAAPAVAAPAVAGVPVAGVAAAPAAAPPAPAVARDPERGSGLFAAIAQPAEGKVASAGGSDSGLFAALDPNARPPAQPAQVAAQPAPAPGAAPAADVAAGAVDVSAVSDAYPGDDATKEQLAAWMGKLAEKRGLPPQLPVMASLVESGLKNLNFGDADSVGFFQMRLSYWNQGDYAGYPDDPKKQVDWFLDQAEQIKAQRESRGQSVTDPKQFGEWIADVERPAEQYRGRYQLQLDQANTLLKAAPPPAAPEVAAAPAPAQAVAEAAVPPAMAQGPGAKAEAALAEAKKFLGTPYKWGGSTPQTGFDCSGLVQWAYAQQGIQIPRVTDQQILATNGTAVKRSELLAGDLVFFRDSTGYVHHVGMSLGGDKFIHAPHTGDVVKISSLDEPYYKEQFTGGRRFDKAASAAPAAPAAPVQPAAPAVDPVAVAQAQAAVARDAAEAGRQGSGLFKAISVQEARNHEEARALASDGSAPRRSDSALFLQAITPERAAEAKAAAQAAPVPPPAPEAAAPAPPAAPAAAAPVSPEVAAAAPSGSGPDLSGVSAGYPGNDAGQRALAKWLAKHAEKAGLPPELPVMASLVESGVRNLNYGDADSVGFFQMRTSIWDQGEYAGYGKNPGLQAKWFIDHALAVKKQAIARGDAGFGKDPSGWGEWIADVERPAEQYRGRYQLRLEEARRLLR